MSAATIERPMAIRINDPVITGLFEACYVARELAKKQPDKRLRRLLDAMFEVLMVEKDWRETDENGQTPASVDATTYQLGPWIISQLGRLEHPRGDGLDELRRVVEKIDKKLRAKEIDA